MTRNECLQEAIKNVTGQRQDDYGSPEDSFSMIAKLWSAYLNYDSISSKDVACMMALLKIARISEDRARQTALLTSLDMQRVDAN